MAAWQGGFPAPANSTTGEITIMNAPAASSHASARLDLRAAIGAATIRGSVRACSVGLAVALVPAGCAELLQRRPRVVCGLAERGGAAWLVVLGV